MNGPIHEVTPLAPRGSEARGIAFEQVGEDDRCRCLHPGNKSLSRARASFEEPSVLNFVDDQKRPDAV